MTGETPQPGETVWKRWEQFDLTGDTEPTYTATIREDVDGIWYVDRKLVGTDVWMSLDFSTEEFARAWLEEQGFAEYPA